MEEAAWIICLDTEESEMIDEPMPAMPAHFRATQIAYAAMIAKVQKLIAGTRLTPQMALMLAFIGDQVISPADIQRYGYFIGANVGYNLKELERDSMIERVPGLVSADRRRRPVKLRDSTQREYKRMLTKAEAKFGTMPIAALEDPRVRQDFMAWRAAVAKQSGNREADNRLSVISAMLSWAKENGQIFANHIAGFRRLHRVDRSELIWLPEHIEAFMRAAPVELQRSLILALHTGQRQGDLPRLA
jgi:DNA-binding MarR family transcriptional regulator